MTKRGEVPAQYGEQFGALEDMAARWPEWDVMQTPDLPARGEEFHIRSNLILVGVQATEDGREWAVAHAVAHLDLGHHLEGVPVFTAEQEADADYCATMRLDVEWDDILLDGEPTVNLRMR